VIVLAAIPDTGCTDWANTAIHLVPASYPTSSANDTQTVRVARTFNVPAAGNYTYYLNAQQTGGFAASTDNIWWVGTEATFRPR
jgi:hypothetical protein